MNKLKVVAVMALAAALVAMPKTAVSAEDGAALYKGKCLMCHGEDGTKSAKANLKTSTMADADIEAMILEGGKDKKPMHAFGKKGITPEQAKALAAYTKGLRK